MPRSPLSIYLLAGLAWLLGSGCLPGRRGALMPVAEARQTPRGAISTAPEPPGSAAAQSAPVETPPAASSGPPAARPAPLPEPAAKADLATRYMGLSGEACEAELRRRKVPFTSARGEAPGVDRPVRIGGALRGVETHEPGPASLWHRSTREILDCRLALALDDFSAILAKHGVVEVVQASLYRKNARIAGRGTPSQHAFGRALDLAVMRKADGTRLDIKRDWHSVIGDRSCGAEATAPRDASPAARELRVIACEAAAAGIFHLILTPSFNAAHRDHLHLDIEPKRVGTEIK